MEQEFINLEKVIDILSYGNYFHISVCDVSGLLSTGALRIPVKYKIHAKKFCNIAKSTAKGYATCLYCKACANNKAASTDEIFSGYCAFGLYEFVKPVIIKDRLVSVIYIGNIVLDKEKAIKKAIRASKATGVDTKALLGEIENAEYDTDVNRYKDILLLIDSYIRMVYEQNGQNRMVQHTSSWLIDEILNDIAVNYDKNITLKKMSKIYFINEKYLGKIFLANVGKTFHQYLNEVRMEHARNDLRNSDKAILNIALDAGFQSASYFNRQFMKFYNITPSQYRISNK